MPETAQSFFVCKWMEI